MESTRQEIDHVRHIRKTVESFQADSDTLDAERAAVEELKKQLDDLEAKATSERHDVIKVKEDEIETDLNANSKVFQGRLRRQLFSEPRQSTSWFQEDNNERYYAKFNEERHAEWQRAQGEAEDCAPDTHPHGRSGSDRAAKRERPEVHGDVRGDERTTRRWKGAAVLDEESTPPHAPRLPRPVDSSVFSERLQPEESDILRSPLPLPRPNRFPPRQLPPPTPISREDSAPLTTMRALPIPGGTAVTDDRSANARSGSLIDVSSTPANRTQAPPRSPVGPRRPWMGSVPRFDTAMAANAMSSADISWGLGQGRDLIDFNKPPEQSIVQDDNTLRTIQHLLDGQSSEEATIVIKSKAYVLPLFRRRRFKRRFKRCARLVLCLRLRLFPSHRLFRSLLAPPNQMTPSTRPLFQQLIKMVQTTRLELSGRNR